MANSKRPNDTQEIAERSAGNLLPVLDMDSWAAEHIPVHRPLLSNREDRQMWLVERE